MMKRFLGLLLCCLLLSGVALAEEDGFTTLTSMEGFYGTWAACSGSGYTYLVLHADGTFEGYEAWQALQTQTPGDALLCRGTYTLDPATGAFTMEGNEQAYTLKTGMASEGMESGDGMVEGDESMPTLLLYAPIPDAEEDEFFDPSTLYLPMSEGMLLLPNYETLASDELEWCQSDTLGDTAPNATSYQFAKDGTGVFLTYTDADEADAVNLTYILEDGLMTISLDDGTVHHWLMQFAYRLFSDINGEPIQDSALDCFDVGDDEEYIVINAVWSDSIILVRDLDNNATFYLNGSH